MDGAMFVEDRRPPLPVRRQMKRAVLMGSHTHESASGVNVHVSMRDGVYLARGWFGGRQFGKTLGTDESAASAALRRILAELDDGVFIPPSESRGRLIPPRAVPRLTLRQLCSDFLEEKRSIRGTKTATTYRSRLAPILDFADQADVRKRWPHAERIDREFALRLREFLFTRDVTANGRSRGQMRKMSSCQVRNCLETLRSVLKWAQSGVVRKLPNDWTNPMSDEVVGFKPSKDPLRTSLVPIDRRIDLVGAMDKWELLNLSILFVLPLRHEDVAGALVSDVDFDNGSICLGSRLGGDDFNKGRVTVQMPMPEQLVEILQACAAGRADGPLFQSRTVWSGRRRPRLILESGSSIEDAFETSLAKQGTRGTSSANDRKQCFRRMLASMGGMTAGEVGKEMKNVLQRFEWARGMRAYDLRGAVTSDMMTAGIRHLELRYLTLHSVSDILNQYTGLDPFGEMQKYFRLIEPLLDAIDQRRRELLVADPVIVAAAPPATPATAMAETVTTVHRFVPATPAAAFGS